MSEIDVISRYVESGGTKKERGRERKSKKESWKKADEEEAKKDRKRRKQSPWTCPHMCRCTKAEIYAHERYGLRF